METASRGGDANEARLHDQQAYISSLQVSVVSLHSLCLQFACATIVLRLDGQPSLAPGPSKTSGHIKPVSHQQELCI